MDPKTNVVKSKSSNSAISKKSTENTRQCNKTSRSNADFPSHGLKKRGVYVEKRSTKINLAVNGKEVDNAIQKAPPRPRPGQKRFLASVLSILSKSTTGTQYPDLEEQKKERKRREKEKNRPSLKDFDNDDVYELNNSKSKKDKFKSKVLNKKFVREDKKEMLVLQCKKEIAQTPSNYSEWSYKDATQNSNFSNLMIHEDTNNKDGFNIADELRNAVLEGRNLKVKKLRYQEDEPKTLVSDTTKGQKNLYNFFVDLLETTISVYNVKADYDAAAPIDASKTNLQINESVANKLNIDKKVKTVEYDDGVVSPQYIHYIQTDDDEIPYVKPKTKPIIRKPFRREVPVRAKPRILAADSFFQSNSYKKVGQKSKSVEMSRKTTFKNKKDLLNVLKQELEGHTGVFEEPKSIFQALRVMARNKRKVSFEPSTDYRGFTNECVLKRRKVISSRKVKKNKDGKKNTRPVKQNKDTRFTAIRKPHPDIDEDESDIDFDESYHSLQVYGYDYEPKQPQKLNAKDEDLTFAYHSSASNIDLDGIMDSVVLNPSNAVSSVRRYSAAVD